jgi:hypothetical protein
MILPVVTKDGVLLPDGVLEYELIDDWRNGGDGYIYYIKVLDAGDVLEQGDIFKPGKTPAIASSPSPAFPEAEVKVEIKAEFSAATMWSDGSGGTAYAYRTAWFGRTNPAMGPTGGLWEWIDTQLKAAVAASYEE